MGISIQAQVPAYGKSNTLDVACWNIKWFGDVTYGPTDEVKQFNNVLQTIRDSKVDIWGLSEISDTTTFNNLTDSLDGYAGVLAPIGQTQKTALIYDTRLFKLVHSKLIITNESYDFASGRFPFEVALLPKYGDQKDTLFFIILHLKANVGNATAKQQSWQRRKNAAGHLKGYIDQSLPQNKVIVLGDFNDDTDTSIYGNNPTPFANFLTDDVNYKFLTTDLSLAKTGSTTGYQDMIDHQLISNEWFSAFTPNSCEVLPLQDHITSFSSTTSDHYPVFASYTYQFTHLNSVPNTSSQIYPNPLSANEKLKIENGKLVGVFDMNGKKLDLNLFTRHSSLRVSGFYFFQFNINGKIGFTKVQVN